MTKLKAAVGVLVLAGLGTILMVERQSQTKRREEPPASRQEAEQVARTNSRLQASDQSQPAPALATSRLTRPRLPAPRVPPMPPAESLQLTNLATRLIHGVEIKLSQAQVESYLEKHGRSAEALIASLVGTGDPAWLGEAVEKHPDDPLVNLVNYGAAILQNEPPEERRQRLDAFKRSAPDNALANYLSAFDCFSAGQTDQAVQELEDAHGKRSLEDYRTGLFQNIEAMYREAGYSAADASTLAGATPIPYLSRLSLLGRQISELADAYRQGGDEPSAQASLQIGLGLGDRLTQATDFPIANLAGIRLQMRLLATIDPDSPYGANGLTVKDQLADLSQREQRLVEAGQQTLSPEDRADGRLWFPPTAGVQGSK
jgi:hypothetical protein